jgi:hypothetical protein
MKPTGRRKNRFHTENTVQLSFCEYRKMQIHLDCRCRITPSQEYLKAVSFSLGGCTKGIAKKAIDKWSCITDDGVRKIKDEWF